MQVLPHTMAWNLDWISSLQIVIDYDLSSNHEDVPAIPSQETLAIVCKKYDERMTYKPGYQYVNDRYGRLDEHVPSRYAYQGCYIATREYRKVANWLGIDVDYSAKGRMHLLTPTNSMKGLEEQLARLAAEDKLLTPSYAELLAMRDRVKPLTIGGLDTDNWENGTCVVHADEELQAMPKSPLIRGWARGFTTEEVIARYTHYARVKLVPDSPNLKLGEVYKFGDMTYETYEAPLGIKGRVITIRAVV